MLRSTDARFTFFLVLGHFTFAILPAFSQQMVIKGSVICPEDLGGRSKRNARFVIVYPDEKAHLATICSEYGYFEINIPSKEARKLRDQSLDLLFLGKSDTVGVSRLFIAPEDLSSKEKKLGEIHLDRICDQVEQSYSQAKSRLQSLKKVEEIVEVKGPSPLGYAGLLLVGGVLGAAILNPRSAAAGPPNDTISTVIDYPDIKIARISPRQLNYGSFLNRLFNRFSQNVGFSFAPLRNPSECAFWNASAMLLIPEIEISAHSDFKQFGKASALLPLNESFAAGAGLYWLHQSEMRRVVLDSIETTEDFADDEILLTLSGATKLSDDVLLGLTGKYIYQGIATPFGLQRTTTLKNGKAVSRGLSVLSKTVKHQKVDVDLSATFRASSAFRVGISLMNVFGSEIQQTEQEAVGLRALGIGAAYQLGRLQLGIDSRITTRQRAEFAAGANLVPMNSLMINAGFSSFDNTVSLSASYSVLFYSFSRSDSGIVLHSFGLRFII